MKLMIFFLSFIFFSLSLRGQQKVVPDFKLESINGEKVSLYELLKEGPVYLNFWAIWCAPCRAELKVLNQIYEQYKLKGLKLLAINIDSPKSMAKVKSFVASQKFSFDVLLDPNSEVFQKFNGKNLPYSLLINQKGEIVKIRNSYVPGDEKEIIKDWENILSKKN